MNYLVDQYIKLYNLDLTNVIIQPLYEGYKFIIGDAEMIIHEIPFKQYRFFTIEAGGIKHVCPETIEEEMAEIWNRIVKKHNTLRMLKDKI